MMVEEVDVVLVHGWAGSAESWRPIRQLLAGEALRVHALRLPGSPGASPAAAPSIGGATQSLIDLLRGIGRPSVIVGHSLGGQVTMRAHGAVPALVSSEVVIDPAYGGASSDRAAMRRWADEIDAGGHEAIAEFFESAAKGLDRADLERLRADLAATSASVIAGYLRSEYVDADAVGLLPTSARAAALRRKPVLALHSSSEGVARERALPSPAGSRIDLWQGSGHYLHLQHPLDFAELLVRWARRPLLSP